ncbi:hypothetical protein [Vagococcus silagei]|nr:hypothetical protein [Vagococcus silagei]
MEKDYMHLILSTIQYYRKRIKHLRDARRVEEGAEPQCCPQSIFV